jgi:hypothetical protein
LCPHTTIYVSSYYYMCPHTTIYVSSYYYVCVLILLCMCECAGAAAPAVPARYAPGKTILIFFFCRLCECAGAAAPAAPARYAPATAASTAAAAIEGVLGQQWQTRQLRCGAGAAAPAGRLRDMHQQSASNSSVDKSSGTRGRIPRITPAC